jgi:hypothetical protein
VPPASGRVSIALLPRDLAGPVEPLWAAVQGMAPDALVSGGFLRTRLEATGDVRFYSNWQGGFAALCPRQGTVVTDRFARALEAWRAGARVDQEAGAALRDLRCTCGETHDLATLSFAPAAGFARGCVWLLDVSDGALRPEALAALEAACGGVRVVLRRG